MTELELLMEIITEIQAGFRTIIFMLAVIGSLLVVQLFADSWRKL